MRHLHRKYSTSLGKMTGCKGFRDVASVKMIPTPCKKKTVCSLNTEQLAAMEEMSHNLQMKQVFYPLSCVDGPTELIKQNRSEDPNIQPIKWFNKKKKLYFSK